ncbi:hypothetical protein [Emticicia fontis]
MQIKTLIQKNLEKLVRNIRKWLMCLKIGETQVRHGFNRTSLASKCISTDIPLNAQMLGVIVTERF